MNTAALKPHYYPEQIDMAEQQQPCTGVISPVLGDIDPNAAPSTHCQTPKIKLTGPRYTKEDLFDIGCSTHHSRSRVEHTGALSPSDAHNAPYINFPAPSPHTTPTLQSGVASDTVVDNAEVNGVGVENSGETGVVAAEVKKKKKKKSSGINKKLKVNPTGFEGMLY